MKINFQRISRHPFMSTSKSFFLFCWNPKPAFVKIVHNCHAVVEKKGTFWQYNPLEGFEWIVPVENIKTGVGFPLVDCTARES